MEVPRRRVEQRKRYRRQEVFIALTALVAALIALPFAPSAHSPEVSSVLAVSAVALLAGHRWAVALVVVAELLLLPGLWPRLLVQPPDVPARIAIIAACLSIVPGVLALRRASATLVSIAGVKRTRRSCRAATAVLALCLIVGAVLPMV